MGNFVKKRFPYNDFLLSCVFLFYPYNRRIHCSPACLRTIQGIQHDKIMYDTLKQHCRHRYPSQINGRLSSTCFSG